MRSRSTETPRPTKPYGQISQAVDGVEAASAPLNRAQAQGEPWGNSWQAGGRQAQARPVISKASVISRISRLKRAHAPKAQASHGHLIEEARSLKKVIASKDAVGSDKSHRDGGVATELTADDSRGVGESRPHDEHAAIFAGDAIWRVHRSTRRKDGDAIFFPSDKCNDRMTVVALSWRREEAAIC